MIVSTSRRRSRIAHFKAPFIVSIAGPAAFGIACGGQADIDDLDQGTRDTSLSSADAGGLLAPVLPTNGQACAGVPPAPSSPCNIPAQCVDGQWVQGLVACNPPPVDSTSCPASPAEVGASCAGYAGGLTCEYEYCYELLPTRRCDEATSVWEELPLPTCNPPPPPIVDSGAPADAG